MAQDRKSFRGESTLHTVSGCTGERINYQVQVKNRAIHFVYLKHEIRNLISQKEYLRIFLNNIAGSDETHFAVYNIKDMKSSLKDSMDITKVVIRKLLWSSGTVN